MTFEEFSSKFKLNLNPQQTEAVKQIDGPVLLLAVPGSGKTTVLTARSAYMIYCADIKPSSIINLTFSRAAAAEMKMRFLQKYELEESQAPKFATIHSFCCSALTVCKKLKQEHIPELEPKYDSIIRKVLIGMMSEYPSDSDVATAASVICFIKNKMLREKEYPELGIKELTSKKVYDAYIKEMRQQDKMDYDDQLVLAYNCLQKYPDILEWFQSKFRYICVDEAQDTSLIQHRIIRLLAAKTRNLFMVGDDDQSIYGFRGAFPKGLLEFQSEYPEAKILQMNTNYRSDTSIISAANLFIKQNKERFNKTIVPYSRNSGTIETPLLGDYKNQHEYLLGRIKAHLSNPGQTLAILYRNNESAFPILTTLMQNGIYVKYRDDAKLYFSHYAVDDILTLLRLAYDPNNIDLFEKIWYKLGLYWKRSTFYEIQTMVKVHGLALFDAIRVVCPTQETQIKKMENAFRLIKSDTPLSAIYRILSDLGYMNFIKDKERTGVNQGAMVKIHTLKAIAAQFNTVMEFLNHINLLMNFKSHPSSITLSTIHSCKGLEFDHVIIIDLFQGILPSADASKSFAVEEEDRRLFYVGITRAKHHLELLAAKSIFGEIKSPSSYIKQCFKQEEKAKIAAVSLPFALPSNFKQTTPVADKYDIDPGTQIVHKSFGKGIVINVSPSGILEISFENPQVIKKLSLEICIKQNLIQVL